ncbi:MAG: hypothetical protein WD025_08590 [Bacteriovoracaceae bacterium]
MKKNLLILLFFAFVVNARAGILIEPYVGMVMNGEIDNGTDVEDYSGQSYGARLAWQQMGLFAGLDYRLSSKEFSFGSSDYEVSENLYAAVIGYEFPIMLRVWGEFILGGEGEVSKDTDFTYEKPSGTILGLGYTGLPFVSLNFEMANYKYSEADGESLNDDAKFSHYLLSVSLPFSF